MNLNDLTYFTTRLVKLHLQSSYRVPLSIHIGLTNRCSNQCVYCCVHKRPQTDVWTTEFLKSVMSEMKASGTRRIHFTGGEPMLRDDIGELISFAKSLNFFVGLSTNGYQVTRRISELKGIDIVYLSYDGPPEVHARLRGKKNVEEIQSALSALKVARIPVWITTVLTRLNADFIEDIVEFSRQQGISVNFTTLDFFLDPQRHFHPSFDEVQELILSGKERRSCFKKLIGLKRAGAPIGSSLGYLQNAFEWLYDDKVTDQRQSNRYRCWAGRATAYLDADGMLYSCGMGVGRISGISVLKKGFPKAWEELLPLDGCQSCISACGVETNLIFSLSASAISNWLTRLHQ
jgi:MoaA/NifB/PqqE/SkfB family radical SAM enzyme